MVVIFLDLIVKSGSGFYLLDVVTSLRIRAVLLAIFVLELNNPLKIAVILLFES